jgi:hypothetical protein
MEHLKKVRRVRTFLSPQRQVPTLRANSKESAYPRVTVVGAPTDSFELLT